MARRTHLGLEHHLLPREPEHEPVAGHEPVVAAAVAVEGLRSVVELVLSASSTMPQTPRPRGPPARRTRRSGSASGARRTSPGTLQCDGPQHRLERPGRPRVGGGEHASDLVALPPGQPAPGPAPPRPQARSTRGVGDGQGVGERQVEAAVDDGPHWGRDPPVDDVVGVEVAPVQDDPGPRRRSAGCAWPGPSRADGGCEPAPSSPSAAQR